MIECKCDMCRAVTVHDDSNKLGNNVIDLCGDCQTLLMRIVRNPTVAKRFYAGGDPYSDNMPDVRLSSLLNRK